MPSQAEPNSGSQLQKECVGRSGIRFLYPADRQLFVLENNEQHLRCLLADTIDGVIVGQVVIDLRVGDQPLAPGDRFARHRDSLQDSGYRVQGAVLQPIEPGGEETRAIAADLRATHSGAEFDAPTMLLEFEGRGDALLGLITRSGADATVLQDRGMYALSVVRHSLRYCTLASPPDPS